MPVAVMGVNPAAEEKLRLGEVNIALTQMAVNRQKRTSYSKCLKLRKS
jgi:hypothetical protein